MRRGPIVTLAIKEARALALPWGTGLAVILTATASGQWRWLAVATYFVAAAVLGGLSVGHEYNHRTLASLLVQPVRRAQVFAVKQAVLAGMLLVLLAATAPVLFSAPAERGPNPWLALTLPFFAGLFLAPHLTIACRSAVAGTIFTLAIPGVLLTSGALLALLRDGLSAAAVNAFQVEFMKWGMAMQCAVSAVMGWRMFLGLEAIDGGGRQFHVAVLRRERSTPAAVRQHPVWLLVRKELRLHAMPVAIAALYFLGWVAANVAARTYDDVLMIFFVLTAFYSTFFALLVGALASAEERLLGTLEWQMLMPIAIRTQWLVKVLVALGLALTLGWGLPILLLQVNAAAHPAILRNGPYLQPLFVGVLMMLTAAGLYASSVATSGLRALLLSLPGLYGAGLFVAWLLNRVEPAIYAAVRAHSMQPGTLFVQDVPELGWLVVGAGFAALVLTFALTNHRSADRPAGRISRQMTWLTASLAAGVTLVAVISAL